MRMQNKSITSVFSSIAERYPDNKAVIHNTKSITYKQINSAANRLACRINKSRHIKPGMIIAMYMPSGIEAIISMLGILKAGHAYLPMDINDPSSRTEDILDNAQPNIIITLDDYKINFKNTDIELLIADNLFDSSAPASVPIAIASDFIDSDAGNPLNNDICQETEAPCQEAQASRNTDNEFSNELSPDSFAYVIYTSGSTGKPKGIPVKHKAVLNLLDDFEQRSPLDNTDKCSLWTNLNFDASVYEIWSALLAGATLVIPDSQLRSDSGKFIQWLKANNITSSYIPPFMISDLAENQVKDPVAFKRILTGVEPISESLLCSIKRHTPGLCLINGYGPAEATVCATLYDVPDYPANPGNAPIGRPVNNLKIYLLDESGKSVKDGEKGEIYIAGIQVADGYLNNKPLSLKSFLKNPFSDNLPGFMYKTGDLGIKLETGDIMFGGRKDFQIKLRGFRIEPGEIENTLKEFPGISQAAIVLKENKTKRKILTAYITWETYSGSGSDSGSDFHLDQDKLMSFLKTRLPGYMVPSAVILLEKMPLTSQDKIDKRNLIKRNDLDVLNKEMPQTEEEKKIAGIWEHFFNISPIYRNDDFLLLGGDSISGVKILSRVNTLFSKNLETNTLFEHSQLKDFALFVRESKNNKAEKKITAELSQGKFLLEQALQDKSSKSKDISTNFSLGEYKTNKNTYIPLLDDQNLIWIFEQINPGTSLYHIPLVYNITGKLNHAILKQSIEIIKKRHIALRSVFLVKDDITIQKQEEPFNNEKNAVTGNYNVPGNYDGQKSIHYEIDHIDELFNEHNISDNNISDNNIYNNNISDNNLLHNNISHNDLKSRWILEKTTASFNLETGPVFRTDLLITGESSCVLCFTFHHIIFDGWSAGLFVRELGTIYNSLYMKELETNTSPGATDSSHAFVEAGHSRSAMPVINEETPELPEPEFSYHDYIPVRIAEVNHAWETAEPFFTAYLKNLPQNSKNSSTDLSGACFPVNIDIKTYNKIKNLALKNRTTSFIVLLSLFQILLFTETGQNDQITGIAYAGRDRVEAEPIIGFLMNTLVVRNTIDPDNSFAIFLDNAKKTIDQVFRYKNIPFQKINHLCRKTSQRKKVFESMFLMQTMDFPSLDLKEIETDYTHIDMGKANCDITLELFENESGLKGWFEYRTDVFSKKRIEQVTKHFNNIITNAMDKPELNINTLMHLNINRDSFPLSPMQHGMLMETLKSPQGAGSYIEQIVFNINQDIDIHLFTKAWEKIIQHHEILRLGFRWKNSDQPLQYITPFDKTFDKINIETNDWSAISKSEADEFLAMFLKADRRLGFSLSKPPLFRIALLKTDKNKYTCVWSLHHAIADGRTMVAILKDLFSVYHNPDHKLTQPGSFKSYIEWLNKQQANTDIRLQTKNFWKKQLKGFTTPIDLPFNLQKKPVSENRRQEYSIAITTGSQKTIIPHATTYVLKKICEKNAITMNSLLMGAWAVLLSHYTGEKDIVFGATRSVRHWREYGENDTGLYINTLPVRININPEENLSDFFNRIRNQWIKTKDFEHSSLSDIHAWSEVKGGNPLFNIFFSYDYHSINTALEGFKEKISCFDVSLLERTPASLFLTVHGINELYAAIEYDQRRFDAGIIKQILGHFTVFLKAIAEKANTESIQRLMDISILTNQEKKEIAEKLNTNKIQTKPDSCIHYLIDIQASLNKNTTAVTDPKNSMTYGELNIYANQIANLLIKLGAIPEKKVVLLLEQDANLIAVILGVLKSGCAYVPLDPGYPNARINYIIDDSAPEIIITSKIHEHRIHSKSAAIVLLDQDMAKIKTMDKSNPKTSVTPENIAYIIYTSGSTGNPKGVMVEHSSLVAFTQSASEIYNIMPDDRVLQFASISFDASAEEIFPTLFSGATLVMKPRGIVHTPLEFIDFCRENFLTVLDLPTSYWHMLADESDSLDIPEHIRLIIIGGDEANPDKVEKWNNNIHSDIILINTYGPTETTIAVTWADLSSGYTSIKEKVSIGLPFPNVSLCILNQFQQPAFPGTRGELCIGGTQTARGYLNRQDLTDKSFVKFENINKSTIFFKTGDNVEMIAGNGILFYGRIDRQIKIRGFRVEPGEIEKTALLHSSIAECAVVVSKDSDKNITLAAFLVLNQKDKEKFSIKGFKTWLLSKLPEYMVPSLLIITDSLAYTPSGKIDYKALKIPQLSKETEKITDISLFNNPYEKDLKEIWETILNFEVSGPDDSFFDIGGSSLYAIKLVSAIEKKFKVSLPVIAVFKSSTIKKLAEVIAKQIQISKLNPKRLISSKGNKAPIILIGHSVGSAQKYKQADLKGHPFYHAPVFIHFYTAEKNETLSLDIWQLAQKCVHDIRSFFPNGPYIIIGSCQNSIVAHEVACQLTNMNKEVELLVIIDENFDKKELDSIPGGKQAKGKISIFKKLINGMNDFGLSYVLKKTWARIKDKIRYYYTSLDNVKERLYTIAGLPVPEAIQFRLMENIFYKACEANPYMPIPYYGPVLIFNSKNWVEKYSPKLRTYYKGEIKKNITVKTTHGEWFDPEQIKMIVNEIDENSK